MRVFVLFVLFGELSLIGLRLGLAERQSLNLRISVHFFSTIAL